MKKSNLISFYIFSAWHKINQCIINSCTDKCTVSASMMIRRVLNVLGKDTFSIKCQNSNCPNSNNISDFDEDEDY